MVKTTTLCALSRLSGLVDLPFRKQHQHAASTQVQLQHLFGLLPAAPMR
jgi:hypothetical protein